MLCKEYPKNLSPYWGSLEVAYVTVWFHDIAFFLLCSSEKLSLPPAWDWYEPWLELVDKTKYVREAFEVVTG